MTEYRMCICMTMMATMAPLIAVAICQLTHQQTLLTPIAPKIRSIIARKHNLPKCVLFSHEALKMPARSQRLQEVLASIENGTHDGSISIVHGSLALSV